VLTVGTIVYLLTLPLGWVSYRAALRKTAAAMTATGAATGTPATIAAGAGEGTSPPPAPALAAEPPNPPERPTRLN